MSTLLYNGLSPKTNLYDHFEDNILGSEFVKNTWAGPGKNNGGSLYRFKTVQAALKVSNCYEEDNNEGGEKDVLGKVRWLIEDMNVVYTKVWHLYKNIAGKFCSPLLTNNCVKLIPTRKYFTIR